MFVLASLWCPLGTLLFEPESPSPKLGHEKTRKREKLGLQSDGFPGELKSFSRGSGGS